MKELDKLDVSADELQLFRFQGQMFDVETGLHYNRFRYYDNDVGMFIQRDPIGLMGGNNVFAYAPNPVGWVDPMGLFNYPSRETAIANLNIKPAIPAHYEYGPRGTRRYIATDYSEDQKKLINIEWNKIVQNDINKHLAAGRMAKCPGTKPEPCVTCADGSGGWKRYGGRFPIKSLAFHCGFDGFLENRIPNNNNPAPANECFYDNQGNLVDINHKYKGCRGTPDYFPFFQTDNAADNAREEPHTKIDPGGPSGPGLNGQGIGWEAVKESARYQAERPGNAINEAKQSAIEGVGDLEQNIKNIYLPSQFRRPN